MNGSCDPARPRAKVARARGEVDGRAGIPAEPRTGGQTLTVVQFVHPGFEYHRREHVGGRGTRSGVMAWKPGRAAHDRKFMLARGSLLDRSGGRDHRSVPLGFWGEWEGPSVFWRVDSPGEPLPRIVHAPFLPAACPTEPVQNTDPLVFGDSIVYSNCLQPRFPSLRTLAPGSIVLFGRHSRRRGRPSFELDTCLVVERAETLTPVPFDDDRYGSDLLADAVLGPLHTEGAEGELTVYFGRRPSAGAASPFSFFPARLMTGSPPLFARPELRPTGALRDVVNPANLQGIRVTRGLTAGDRDAVWDEVARQVSRQGCGLGYQAAAPPILEPHEAEAAAEGDPRPLGR